MKATHLWYAALAVLALFLAAVPTDAHPVPGKTSMLSGHLDDLGFFWDTLDPIEQLVPLPNVNKPSAHSFQPTEAVRSGLGSVADEATSQFRPLDGAGQANIHPQNAEAALQLRAAQRSAEKRPMSFPDRTSLADHDQGGYINFGAAAPATDTPLAYWATHGRRAARGKRTMALGNSPVPTNDELEADKRLNIASTRNDEGSEAVRRGPNAAMKRHGRGKVEWGDDKLADVLLNVVRTSILELLKDDRTAGRKAAREVKLESWTRAGITINKFFSTLTRASNPTRTFIHDPSTGYVFLLSPYKEIPRQKKWYTATAFRAQAYRDGNKDRTVLGELVVSASAAEALEAHYSQKLSEAIDKALGQPAVAGEARAVVAER